MAGGGGEGTGGRGGGRGGGGGSTSGDGAGLGDGGDGLGGGANGARGVDGGGGGLGEGGNGGAVGRAGRGGGAGGATVSVAFVVVLRQTTWAYSCAPNSPDTSDDGNGRCRSWHCRKRDVSEGSLMMTKNEHPNVAWQAAAHVSHGSADNVTSTRSNVMPGMSKPPMQ
eukprot:351773-Chlamydomonas_euryale.AAC.29